MTTTKSLPSNFQYTQQSEKGSNLITELDKKQPLTKLLQNIHVTIYVKNDEKQLLIHPLVIQKTVKKLFKLIPVGDTLSVNTSATLPINDINQQTDYHTFKTNMMVLLERMKQDSMPFYLTKFEALAECLDMSQMIKRLASELDDFEDCYVETDTLYNVLSEMTPDLKEYMALYEQHEIDDRE